MEFTVNVNVHVHIPDIPMSSADCIITPLVLEYTLLQPNLWGEFWPFSAGKAIDYNSAFFIPPGTHYCWLDRGSMDWEVARHF